MSASVPVPRVSLGNDGYTMSRLLVGGWQLSRGHRPGTRIDEDELFADLDRMVAAGLTTFDCADIYTGVEELFGRFAATSLAGIEVHTKYVPDEQDLTTLTKKDVEGVIDRSLRRLRLQRLDLVQFAWWDYARPRWRDAVLWLDELREKGKIRHLGLTNFDTPHVQEMLDAGIPIVAHQVQYSLLDRRPEHGMAELAQRRGFALIAYGALAGGMLSERWLGARATPAGVQDTRSLTKYSLIVDEFGGVEAREMLLAALARVAGKHGVSIPAVALRWVLDRPAVSGVLVGTFRGSHLESNLSALELELDPEDRASIESVLATCHPIPGDCFDLERDPDGPHATIMRKNLSRD